MKKNNSNGGYLGILMIFLGVIVIIFILIRPDVLTGKGEDKNIINQGLDSIDKAIEVKNLIENRLIDKKGEVTLVSMPEEKKLAIEEYLLTQKDFAWQTIDNSHNFCEILNLSEDPEGLFPAYVWARCGEFTYYNEQVKEESGVSLPAKINYPNELSFFDLNRFNHEIPRDGSFNGEDIERIFPAYEQKQIADSENKKKLNYILILKALNWFKNN